MPTPGITVFTPAFNRAHTLGRVFDSLVRQHSTLFEWLVVDDGSTDETTTVLADAIRIAPFNVRVVKQPNGGKHRAHNTAIQHARGELTVILDSDDELAPGAIEAIWEEWSAIPSGERNTFAGILAHSIDESGSIVGAAFPRSPMDGKYFDLVASNVMIGEKLPCYRTDVLRRFPFPELAHSNAYVPEGVIWVEIGKTYKLRCVNRSLRVYHRDAADKTAIMNRYAAPESNSWGRMRFLQAILNLGQADARRFPVLFAKAAAGYVRYGLHSGYSIDRQGKALESRTARALWLAAIPLGCAAFLFDRARRRSSGAHSAD
ncbi:MAG TPA: glycosyltransferase family 2 protein [Gemmatimonadaceae bacterium]|nr:glycosyltransferase family 2 protein [Gemmatimonadaceae bacterium]